MQARIVKGAVLEATEDKEILVELMDWSRCLSIGLQSQKVLSTIYGFYTEANQKRMEFITKNINDTLKENESAILFMSEGHHIQFASDIRIFYVSPPALDDIRRWMRDFEAKMKEEAMKETQPEGDQTKPD